MTGVQALERKHPDLPMLPGKVELREFEYNRHGTLSFTSTLILRIENWLLVQPSKTRNEKDFVEHIKSRVTSDPLTSTMGFFQR